MFDEDARNEISAAAGESGIEPTALLAVAEVESGGVAYAVVDGRREPLIRFEGHYFDARLTGGMRVEARKQGLASPRAGAVPNPPSQAARWKLLARAAAFDARAAYESVSWGLGQVMGANWPLLGYAGVDALVAEARASAAGQARLMALYVVRTGLATALARHDWAAFARGYNGPRYARDGYDGKIAAAYRRYAGAETETPARPPSGAHATAPMLARGAHGAAVAALQHALAARGEAIAVDGQFGPATEAALVRVQRALGLKADGIAGPRTLAALSEA